MAQRQFNIMKGQWRYFAGLPGLSDALQLILFKSAGIQADDVLDNYGDLAAMKASNAEADFNNYSPRIELASGISIVQNNTTNAVDLDFPDQTIFAAGGIVTNTLAKLVVAYKPVSGALDSAIIPMWLYDFSAVTNGSDLIIRPDAGGLIGTT